MTVKQNSIESYISLIESNEIGEKQEAVLRFIQKHPNCTYNEISRVMGQHHNTVVARVNELRYDLGLIVGSGNKVDEFTGKTNTTYRLRKEGEPRDIKPEKMLSIPRNVYDYMVDTTIGRIIPDTYCKQDDRNIKAIANDDNTIRLEMGDVLIFERITAVCEDIAQRIAILSGDGFSIKMRID